MFSPSSCEKNKSRFYCFPHQTSPPKQTEVLADRFTLGRSPKGLVFIKTHGRQSTGGLYTYKSPASIKKKAQARIICAYLCYYVTHCTFYKCAGLVNCLHFTADAALSHSLNPCRIFFSAFLFMSLSSWKIPRSISAICCKMQKV